MAINGDLMTNIEINIQIDAITKAYFDQSIRFIHWFFFDPPSAAALLKWNRKRHHHRPVCDARFDDATEKKKLVYLQFIPFIVDELNWRRRPRFLAQQYSQYFVIQLTGGMQSSHYTAQI